MSPSFAKIVRDDFHYAPTVAFVSLSNKEPNSNAVPKFYVDAITHFLIHLLPDLRRRLQSEKVMKRQIMAFGVGLIFVCQTFAGEHAALARVTAYWFGQGSGAKAAWNGTRLNEGHCAVDPKKIPYGSKVVFHDAECLAVDSGPDVVNRKAARLCGRSAPERDAIVIDRFFYTKQKAVAWVKAHPQFMTVRVRTPDTEGAY